MQVFNDCITQYITSELIDEFVDAFPEPGFTLSLQTSCGCSGENVTVELEPSDISVLVAPNRYVLSLPVGIHNLKLIKREGNTQTEDALCYFNECGLICDIVDLVAEGNHDAWKYFEALRLVNECDECTCTKACVIWEELSKILNQSPCA